MKGIRRSLNKDRIGAPAPGSVTKNGVPAAQAIGQRPAAAPPPPKLVIRATTAYRAQTPQELSFNVGDFFHVVSDEGGEDWFDASNPVTNARGLVPAEHFQVLGRNVRETAMQGQQAKKLSSGSMGSGKSGSLGAVAGGGSWKPGAPAAVGAYPSSSKSSSASPYAAASSPTSPAGSTSSGAQPPSQPAAKHQPLYGVVQYDFVAERQDELDAKKGEPIIVIAQSNHEWFVAKPIGRLGGPGLIPVTFVEIQDMATGKPVENVEELIRSAVVPKVEEWKKMTAEYKQASIPLGRFDFSNQPAAPASTSAASTSASFATHTPDQYASHDSHQQQQHPQSYQLPTSPPDPPHDQQGYDDGYDQRYSYSRERRQYGLVTSASVESFHQEEGSFWFHLRAFFSTGASLVLYRLYQDFFDFQVALMAEFPVEAGRAPGDDGRTERILPMMPGPTDYEDEVVCAQRVHDLSIYLADLCALPEHIRGSGLMYEFLVPRAGDVEVTPGNVQFSGEPSPVPSQGGMENQYGEVVDYLDQMDGRSGGPRGSSGQQQQSYGADVADQMGRMSLNGGQYADQQQRHPQQHGYNGQNPYQQQQGYYDAPSQPALPPMGNANQGVPFIKIKIFHRNTDDLIAIRVPPTVSHPALLDKVRERLGSDVTHLRYREEVGSVAPTAGSQVVMAGGARLIMLENDEDLERWVRSGAKLVLYAD
ncbi:budemergence protein 1 [Rhodotorula toruloides]|uniref:Budemergence protein 1 n=1 Tax=Rhodotorula toruloides TaxID=5286 RepID=A0A511KIZ9_RHOTO|nr:budemergence protein 1 [Rhodotorula toruloides]